MMNLHTVKTAVAGTLAVIAALAAQTPATMASDNPFKATTASDAYTLLAAEGMDKCGGGMNPEKKGCKMLQMDSNGDGKVSKDEFLKGHEVMFEKMDHNGDGMLDDAELRAHKGMMKDEMMGKCGEQKGAE
jgi:hypothetical protein